MGKWPHDNQNERVAFYGDPGMNEIERQLVDVIPPFKMWYTGDGGVRTLVTRIRFHKKAAPALAAALNEIWLAYGKDQSAIDRAGLSEYNGAYEKRLVRGSTSKWSNHAFGCAIDLNASHNPLGAERGQMPQQAIDAFCRQGAMWGGWYAGRKDLMHFEFVDNGGRAPKNPPPRLNTAAANVAPVKEANAYDEVLKELQQELYDMGYFEVGLVDGYDGGRTKAAIAAFLADCNLEKYTTFGTLLDYAKRKRAAGFMRPVTPMRAYATANDIAPKVASVKPNAVNRLFGKIMAVPTAVGVAGYGVVNAIPSAYSAASPVITIVREFLDFIPGWVYLIIVAALGFAIWRQSNKTESATVADYQQGRIN